MRDQLRLIIDQLRPMITVTDESCVSVDEEMIRSYEMMRSKKLRKGRR